MQFPLHVLESRDHCNRPDEGHGKLDGHEGPYRGSQDIQTVADGGQPLSTWAEVLISEREVIKKKHWQQSTTEWVLRGGKG